jgi:hypothetical protein
MRLLSFALAVGIALPQKARARARSDGEGRVPGPPELKSRRRVARAPIAATILSPARSPCGRYLFEVEDGAVYVNGRRIHPELRSVHVLAPPVWRDDGDALAWLEREGSETRLVVLPTVGTYAEPLAWPLPRALGSDQLHWAGPCQIVVGPQILEPHAVASWTE